MQNKPRKGVAVGAPSLSAWVVGSVSNSQKKVSLKKGYTANKIFDLLDIQKVARALQLLPYNPRSRKELLIFLSNILIFSHWYFLRPRCLDGLLYNVRSQPVLSSAFISLSWCPSVKIIRHCQDSPWTMLACVPPPTLLFHFNNGNYSGTKTQ